MEERSAESRRKMMNDSSSAIAAKLLEGWTLLNDHCPQCLTPLVRNRLERVHMLQHTFLFLLLWICRQRRMYCVTCCQWIITETEAATQVLENRVDTSLRHEEAAAVSQPVTEDRNLGNAQPRTTASSSVQQYGADAISNQFNSFTWSNEGFLEPTHGALPSNVAVSIPNSASQAAIDGGTRNNDRVPSREESGRLTSLALPKVELPPNTGAVLSQTVSILIQKIEEMSQLIAVTREPQNLKQLLETLEHCVQVIQQIVSVSTR